MTALLSEQFFICQRFGFSIFFVWIQTSIGLSIRSVSTSLYFRIVRNSPCFYAQFLIVLFFFKKRKVSYIALPRNEIAIVLPSWLSARMPSGPPRLIWNIFAPCVLRVVSWLTCTPSPRARWSERWWWQQYYLHTGQNCNTYGSIRVSLFKHLFHNVHSHMLLFYYYSFIFIASYVIRWHYTY